MFPKSHYAVYIYIQERYAGVLERRFITELNALRIERHQVNYGLELVSINNEEARTIITIAHEFIQAVEKILK